MPGRIRALEANGPLIADSIVNRGYKYRVQSHALIQEFCLGGGEGGGGGGGSRPDCQKTAFSCWSSTL